jgi:glutathione S-transferase
MQLWYAPTSPFARKVRVAALELGLPLELVEVDPWTDERLRRLNPLSKVPTLVADNGAVLYESGVICQYLEALAGTHQLFPSGDRQWQVLLLQGLCDGLSTSAGRLFADERREKAGQPQPMIQRFHEALRVGLDHLEGHVATLAIDDPTIGEIAAAVTLGYLDFRWPDRNWRTSRPNLSVWFDALAMRPSMIETRHHLIGQPLR